MDIKESLVNFGLKEKEATLYLDLLTRGVSSAQEMADATGIIRQTVYDVSRELIAQGLISVHREGKSKKYRAANPSQLLHILEQKASTVQDILPSLQELQISQQKQPTVTSYQGFKGLKNLLYLTLESKDPLFWMSNYEQCHKIFQDHIFFNYTIQRVEKKIPLHIMIEPSGISEEELVVWKTDSSSFRKTRLHKDVEAILSTYIVFGDSVIILNMSSAVPQGIHIQDATIAQSQKAIFEKFWTEAKELE